MARVARQTLIDDPRVTAFGILVEANARLERVMAKSLSEEVDIPLVYLEVLLRIARSPDRQVAMGELAAQISLTSGGVTRLVDRMTQADLVSRTTSSADRRVSYLGLTTLGGATLERALRVHLADLDEHFVSRLSTQELSSLVKILDKLRAP
jgi:MarR family transcriptional regulator, 2-MHQ and catechol-resistance regulon repressor